MQVLRILELAQDARGANIQTYYYCNASRIQYYNIISIITLRQQDVK